MGSINNVSLFGFPVMTAKIDKRSYDKKSIITAIEKNFKLNKKRNHWDKISVLHHSYNDEPNSKYHRVDFNSLLPVYKKVLMDMFKHLEVVSNFDFDFAIVNYTCLAQSHYMASHVHNGADFTAVHYIQFDKKHHTSTVFENALPHTEFIHYLNPQLAEILSPKHPSNSWAYKDWSVDIEEDDFSFSPAFLRHKIYPQVSKTKNRITVVVNITMKRKK